MSQQTKAKNPQFEMTKFNPNEIVDFSKWKQRQQELVKENPFVEIVDRETYETAKQHRTALRTGRTDLQKERDDVKKELNNIKTFVVNQYDEFIEISKPHEDRQQDEVKRHEAELEAEKQREAEIAQQRADGIRTKIDAWENKMIEVTQHMTVHTIDESRSIMARLMAEIKEQRFDEFTFLMNEAVERQEQEFIQRVNQLQQAEQRRLDDLRIQRQSLINEMFVQATKEIDKFEGTDQKEIRVIIDDIFTTTMEFGEFEKQYHDTWSEMIDRSKAKAKANQDRENQDKEQELNRQKNRIMEVREGLLDLVFQMDVDNVNDQKETIKTKMTRPDGLIPELWDEWKKAMNQVQKQFDQKMEMIDFKMDQEKKERIRLEEIKNARWKKRKPQLIKMGFEHDVHGKMFRHSEYSIELSIEPVFTYGDESWKLVMDDAKKEIKFAKESDAKEQERQNKLAMDKENLIEWINHGIRINNPGNVAKLTENDVMSGLHQEMIGELNQWCDDKIQQIKKF